MSVPRDEQRDRADALIAAGAGFVGEFDEPEGRWITLLDPEGNEFCLH